MPMFEDRTRPKVRETGKDFVAPKYDNRSGPRVAAGDYYGVGVRNPVGKMRASSIVDGPIDMKSKSARPEQVV